MIALAVALLAAGTPANKLPPRPIDFGAASMTLEPKDNRTRLEGSVWFDRQDLRVTGDRATALFVEATHKEKESTLERFTVEGAVHVEKPGAATRRSAEGNHAVYDAPKGTLLLQGPPAAAPAGFTGVQGPVLRDGAELMIGDRVLLNLETDEVDVQRPRLFLKRSLLAPSAAEPKTAIPVRVEAGTLRLDQQRKVARFRDKVVIHRGDLTVRGPIMDARYDDQGQLTTLEMRGGVEMIDGDRRAVGQQADYDAATRLLVLTGDPKLFDRGDVLRGTRITLQLDSRDVKVERATGRLRPEQHKDERGAGGGGAR